MNAATYSPLADGGRQQRLHDKSIMYRSYADEEDPFDALTRGSVTSGSEDTFSDGTVSPSSTFSSTSRPSLGRSSTSQATPSIAIQPIRRPLVSANTFPTFNFDPWSTVRASRALESNYASTLTPEYRPVDEQARTFRLQAPFIYTTKSSNIPRYQIQQEFDRSGKPSRLNIRRLQSHEMRSCSVPATHAALGPRMRYDKEGTAYTMTPFEMHGKQSSTLPGTVQISSGKTLWGGQWTRIWHVSKPNQRDSKNLETDVHNHRMSRRSLEECDKRLLFAVKKGVWEDAEGTIIAREEKGWGSVDRLFARRNSGQSANGKVLDMTDMAPTDASKRDLVVACWVMKMWMAEGIRWD
ncbi:hypothetical protein BKA66DRAFT_453878 [Pyrenochaeta sp. MPI-SDFR-AT-0127]|nr:hypothetical protein BKA66DRAFT_453878 [Pyrenochaeta sp. MPI-SDFR-AT-0127]